MLRPAVNFTHEMSRDGPAIADLYPRLHQILADTTLLATRHARELRAVLFSDLEKTFPMESIPDDTLIATYLHPSNLQVSELFDVRMDLKTKAEGLILARQKTLLDGGFRLYAKPPPSIINFEKTLRRELEDYWEYAREAAYEVVDRKNPQDWWSAFHGLFRLLPVFPRICLSIQASPAASERLFSLVGLIFTKNRSGMDGSLLKKMALMESWYKTINEKRSESQ